MSRAPSNQIGAFVPRWAFAFTSDTQERTRQQINNRDGDTRRIVARATRRACPCDALRFTRSDEKQSSHGATKVTAHERRPRIDRRPQAPQAGARVVRIPCEHKPHVSVRLAFTRDPYDPSRAKRESIRGRLCSFSAGPGPPCETVPHRPGRLCSGGRSRSRQSNPFTVAAVSREVAEIAEKFQRRDRFIEPILALKTRRVLGVMPVACPPLAPLPPV